MKKESLIIQRKDRALTLNFFFMTARLFWPKHPGRGVRTARFATAPLDQQDLPEMAYRFRLKPRGYGGYRPRYPYRRRSYRRTRNPGVQALREVRQIRRNQELKNAPIPVGSVQVPIGGLAIIGTLGPMLVQGTTATTRLGNKTTIKSISMRFNVDLAAMEANGTTVRLFLVWDKHPNGAAATVLDMMTTNSYLSGYNTVGANRGRFQFIADKYIDFGTTQGKWSDKFFMKKDLQVIYDGNAGTIADIEQGALLIMGMAANNAAAIDIFYQGNCKFTDD